MDWNVVGEVFLFLLGQIAGKFKEVQMRPSVFCYLVSRNIPLSKQ